MNENVVDARSTGVPPTFDAAFRERLNDLFRWRRDVRRFRPDPIGNGIIEELTNSAALSPSVGFSQPWRFVLVDSADRRAAIRESFIRCNRDALADYEGERAKLYASLKLEGLETAPRHLAVFADETTATGHGLGRKTMPEMLRYSVVMAVHALWLAARARGIGVGWVSILEADVVKSALDVPDTWALVAYLCIGFPELERDEPELLRAGWETRAASAHEILRR
jgi:5,6-dimethylbenzimidazole synthase